MGNMKFAKDISFETIFFSVTADKIIVCKAEKIEMTSSNEIKVVYSYNDYYGGMNDTTLKTRQGSERMVFLNLSEAQKKQSDLRKRKISYAFTNMINAQNHYNELIEEYFNKPLSNPFKK